MSGSTTPTTFAYTGKTDTYTAPYTALYDVVALDAQGGGAIGGAVGGKGASISGDVVLTQGEVLTIAVGGQGGGGASLAGGGGGGGSFVVGPNDTPIVIAGGGGGGGGAYGPGHDNGGGGQTGPAGGVGGANGGVGGTDGTGGNGGSAGGGGGGLESNGTTGPRTVDGSSYYNDTILGRGGNGFPGLQGGNGGNNSGTTGGDGGFGGGGAIARTGGGGGGTFVVAPGNTPLMIAGGGGGGGVLSGGFSPGGGGPVDFPGAGRIGQGGEQGFGSPAAGFGGINGAGGQGSTDGGGGGGGFTSSGADGGGASTGGGGYAGLQGGKGAGSFGAGAGGFGGGGGAFDGPFILGGGGGGGGYSGGGGGSKGGGAAGGGGSFDGGTDQVRISGENSGSGKVVLTFLGPAATRATALASVTSSTLGQASAPSFLAAAATQPASTAIVADPLHSMNSIALSQGGVNQLTLGSDYAKLGTPMAMTANGNDDALSFSPQDLASGAGNLLAVLHGAGSGATLGTLTSDHAPRIT